VIRALRSASRLRRRVGSVRAVHADEHSDTLRMSRACTSVGPQFGIGVRRQTRGTWLVSTMLASGLGRLDVGTVARCFLRFVMVAPGMSECRPQARLAVLQTVTSGIRGMSILRRVTPDRGVRRTQ
jgi:hypothetical protein